LRDLINMLDDLKQRGVKFRSLAEATDTDTPTGRAMWQMIGVLAELERSRFGRSRAIPIVHHHHATASLLATAGMCPDPSASGAKDIRAFSIKVYS
jgi:hypothetical protein